jgi:hypothetical protein
MLSCAPRTRFNYFISLEKGGPDSLAGARRQVN